MKAFKIIILALLLLITGPSLFTLNASAGTEDAEMTDLVITATPYRQGLGGEISIEASVSFFGGCCYPLFAYDVKASIDIPENVRLLKGETTQKIDEVEAQEGGAATVKQFKWVINSLVPDSYEIFVNISSKNCGNLNGRVTIEVTEGFSISIPKVYPDMPDSKKETIVMVDISTSLEGKEVESVSLYYLKSEYELSGDLKKLSANNDTLIWPSGNKKGTSIPLESVEYSSDTWKGIIPQQNSESFIYYWLVATDNFGKNTTGVVYSFKTTEIDRIYFLIDVLNWLPVIVTIIGIIIIVFLFNKVQRPAADKGVFILGSNSIKELHSTMIDSSAQKKLNQRRNMIVIILLICSIILLFWSAYSGDLEAFTRLNGGM